MESFLESKETIWWIFPHIGSSELFYKPVLKAVPGEEDGIRMTGLGKM